MNAKLELVMRKIDSNLIVTGVMITDNFRAGGFMGVKLIGRKISEDSIAVFISKQSMEISDPYNQKFDESCLSELPTENIWRRFASPDPVEFGGVAIARDNRLFADEKPDEVSRTAIMSVIDLGELTFDFEHHCAFRSEIAEEHDDMYVFVLKKDKSDETAELLSSLMGDSIKSCYTKPFWTRDNGDKYQLKTVNHPDIDALYKRQAQDLVQFGELTEETETMIDAKGRWLKLNKDESYRSYLVELSEQCPFYLDSFDRLLTADENKQINDCSQDILREMM